jgi:hypothetical protein
MNIEIVKALQVWVLALFIVLMGLQESFRIWESNKTLMWALHGKSFPVRKDRK